MIQLFAGVADPDSTIPGRHITATAPAAYEIHIAGTNHMSLTDVPLISPALVALIGDPKGLNHQAKADAYHVIETMNDKVLEFFDSYLKGKGSFTSAGTY